VVRIPTREASRRICGEYARALIGLADQSLGRAVAGRAISAPREPNRRSPRSNSASLSGCGEPSPWSPSHRTRELRRVRSNAVIKTVLAPIYLRLLITVNPWNEEPLTRPRVALAAAHAARSVR